MSGGGITVGIDIGTTSVKALAVDAEGSVLARARVPHPVRMPTPEVLEHDPDVAWRAGVASAWAQVSAGRRVDALNVAAMVPSLAAVDVAGRALTPGLLYGDARGGGASGASPAASGELLGFLRWCAAEAPGAAGYWPAQAVANHTLCGAGAIDTVTAMTTVPLFDFTGWDPGVAAGAGVRPEQLPRIVAGSEPVGTTPEGTLVGGGTVDAFGEQLVAGADRPGDVLVILGTTLVIWAVVEKWTEVPGLWTVPHSAPGLTLVGGASNAGGLFVDWARRLLADIDGHVAERDALDPSRIPVWLPYVRGERTPLHDPARRASLSGLDVGMNAVHARRAAWEATGFVVRHHLELAGLLDGGTVAAQRIVVSGGGVRVAGWVDAIADATGLPVDVVAVPEGGALGAAYLARCTAGLEADTSGASRWARTERRVEPDDRWVAACAERYGSFRDAVGRDAGSVAPP